GVLGDITAGAGADDLKHEGVAVLKGMHQHFDLGRLAMQQFGGFEAVHAGHVRIHEDDIGMKFLGFGHGFAAVGGLTDDFHVGIAGKKGAQPSPDYRMIISQQQSDFNGGFCFRHKSELVFRIRDSATSDADSIDRTPWSSNEGEYGLYVGKTTETMLHGAQSSCSPQSQSRA